MDIQKIINDVLAKLKDDEGLLAKFKAEPVKTLEGIIGIDLPDDQVKQVAELVKAKIDLDKAADLLGSIGGLFKK